jgi:AcrR family transcriptional regulator
LELIRAVRGVRFSHHGYDGIGVREIAQTAGVTGVLVNRYFGSKQEERAAMILALILGFLLTRKVIRRQALSDANGHRLSEEFRMMFQRLIDSSASVGSPRGQNRAKKHDMQRKAAYLRG